MVKPEGRVRSDAGIRVKGAIQAALCAIAIGMGLFLALTRRRAGTEAYA